MRTALLIATVALFGGSVVAALPALASIESARKDISRLRFDRAESELVDVARAAKGGKKQEALFLLAGLKKSVSEAEIIYQEVVRIDIGSAWAREAQVELAKIQYALGDYDRAFDILDVSGACRGSEEACFFQGLSALMLKRYSEAESKLSRVRRGRYQSWAFLALAEIEMGTNRADGACRKYERMSRSYISPTAMYRYGECLERDGKSDDATDVFRDLIETFRSTPEAVLATQKIEVLERKAGIHDVLSPAHSRGELVGTYTIQFGAFYDRTNAIRLASELKREIPGVRIDSDLVDNREIHRVRVGQFRTREEAQLEAEAINRRVREPVTIMTLH